MGLDGVELVMAFEEEFGIEISDADAERMQTPRDVVDYIAQFCTGQEHCTSRNGFYRLRRHCINQHSVIRSAVRPQTPLSRLLPANQIRKAWTQLKAELSVPGRSWPELDYPVPLRYGLFVIFLSLLVGLPLSIALATSLAVFPYALLVSGLLTFGIWKMFDKLMAHHRTVIPDSVATVGLLIQAVIPSEWIKVSNTITHWGRERIAKRVKRLVIHHLGISESDYREDARFIEDFGAD